MDASYADVVDVLDGISHEFRGDYCFFGYGDVAGSGGDYSDHAFAVALAVALEDDGAGQRAVFGFLDLGGYGGVLLFSCARRQDISAVFGQAAEDGGYLLGRFALAEDHFGHALPEGSVVVDLGEAEVFEGQVTEAGDGLVGGDPLRSDLIE
jgi:hypothetical protein